MPPRKKRAREDEVGGGEGGDGGGGDGDGGDGDGGDGEPDLLGELEEMIAGKKRREASEAQTRIDIDKEMDDVMDVGLRVNRPLAEALLGA